MLRGLIWSSLHLFTVAESKANCKVGEEAEHKPGRSSGLAAECAEQQSLSAEAAQQADAELQTRPGISWAPLRVAAEEELGFSRW